MTGTATAPAVDLATVVDRLRRIPLWARRFSVGPEPAAAVYRVDAELAERLVAAGLPHVRAGERLLFDDYDLTNLSLYLRLRSPQRAAMRYWAGVLTRPEGEARTYSLEYLVTCPTPGHPGPCEFLCCTPGDGELLVRRDGDSDAPLATMPVPLRNDWPRLPDPLVELIGELSGVSFYRLPDAIKWDTGFMLREGIGDCLGIARYLTERGRTRGLRMRAVFGLIVAPPYATPHFWAEVAVGDRWVPADPGLVQGMTSWGLLAPGWPADRSPGAFLAPLTSRHGFAVSHRGVAATVSFRTRLG